MTELGAEENTNSESPLKFVPLITSTPLAGTGVGAAVSYLYRVDKAASMSQLQTGAQYTDTDSTSFFIRNNAFLAADSMISNTVLLLAKTNSELKQSGGETVRYQFKSQLFNQKLLVEIRDNIYLGGKVGYKNIEYFAKNEAGENFLFDNGIIDEESVGVGITGSYDTRISKYFPRDAFWIDLDVDTFPSAFGADDTYQKVVFNARYYKTGLAPGDVWASQFYGEYSSEKTPDSGLATLSGKALLRGYPGGQFKARFLNGLQTEYRYQVVDTAFKVTAFLGAAYLSGGSFGQDGRQRDDDGMYYAGGAGFRYAIQSRTGVDLRVDIVTTSEEEQSLYVALNQAF